MIVRCVNSRAVRRGPQRWEGVVAWHDLCMLSSAS